MTTSLYDVSSFDLHQNLRQTHSIPDFINIVSSRERSEMLRERCFTAAMTGTYSTSIHYHQKINIQYCIIIIITSVGYIKLRGAFTNVM